MHAWVRRLFRGQRVGSLARKVRSLRIESLEDRITPSFTPGDALNLTAPTAAVAGATVSVSDSFGGDDQFFVQLVGGKLRISNGLGLNAGADATQIDANTVEIDAAPQTLTSLHVAGNGGDDTLTIDFTGGNPIDGISVSFDGGAGGFDSLALMGMSGSGTFTFDNEHDGSISFPGVNVAYIGLEPISVTGNINDIVLTYSGVSETIDVTDGVSDDGMISVDSTAGETISLPVPSGSLTIDAGDGNDTINVVSLDAQFAATLIIDGAGGNDTVNIGGITLDTGFNGRGLDVLEVEIIGITDATIQNNSADYGAGVRITASTSGPTTATITNTTIRNNAATISGGGIYNDGAMTILNGSTIGGMNLSDGNTASGDTSDDGGGGIFSTSGTVTLTGGTSVRNNVADGNAGSGGGIFMLDGSLVVQTGTTIDDNIANRAGGGIEIVNGNVSISGGGTAIRRNRALGVGGAPGIGGNGGGLHVTSTASVTFNNAIVSDNIATNEGGGLWNSATGTLNVISTAVDNNIAQGNGGGGIFNNGGTLDLDSGAGPFNLNGNQATGANGPGEGGGILSVGGTVTIDSDAGQNANMSVNSAVTGGAFVVRNGTLFRLNSVQMTGNSTPSIIDSMTTVEINTEIGSAPAQQTTDIVEINTPAIGGEGNFRLTIDGTPYDVVSFTNVGSLDVNFLAEDDSVNVAAHTSTVINLDGGTPSVASPGDTLTYFGDGVNAVTLSPAVISTANKAVINYVNFETIGLSGDIVLEGTAGLDDITILATGPDNGSYRIGVGPFVSFNGATSFTFNGLAGDDSMTIDYGTGGLTIPIRFDGGADTDILIILGTPTGGPVNTATYSFTGTDAEGHNGTIDLDGVVVTFDGLEPILNSGDAADVVFNLPDVANPDATLLANVIAGQMLLAGSTFENTIFANPSNSLTINGGSMDDTITVASVDIAFDASLIVNGMAGFDTVSLSAPITLTGSHGVDVSGDTILVNASIVTADGEFRLTADRNIELSALADIQSSDGDIVLNANQQPTRASGDFQGIRLEDASIQTFGTGNILIAGRGGDVAGVNDLTGISVSGSSQIRSNGTSGSLTLTGTGGDGNNRNYGINVQNDSVVHIVGSGELRLIGTVGAATGTFAAGIRIGDSSSISSEDLGAITIIGTGGSAGGSDSQGVRISSNANGAISAFAGAVSITGTATSATGSDSHGVYIDQPAGILSNGSATISITGTAANPSSAGIALASGSGTALVLGGDAADGSITLTADTIQLESGTDLNIQSIGELIVRPFTAGTSIGVGGGAGTLQITDELIAAFADGFTSITIGDATTGTVTVDSASFTDPLTIVGATTADAGSGSDIMLSTGDAVTFSGGSVAPGGVATAGTFAVDGDVDLADGEDFSIEIEGTVAGTNYDQLTATGSVDIGANVTLTLTGGYTPTQGDTFTLISRTGGSGTFLGLPEGAVISNVLGSGLVASITYTGGDGDDVVLTVQAETSVTLLANPTSSVFGQSVIFTALVGPVAPGFGVPTGSVSFYDGIISPGTLLGTEQLSGSGTATLTTNALSRATHTIIAAYAGDPAIFRPSTNSLVFVVSPAPPTVVTPIPDQMVDEDAADVILDLTSYFDDIEDGAAALTYTVTTNTNSALVSTAVGGTMLTLSFEADGNGTATITVQARDSNNLTVTDTFDVWSSPRKTDSELRGYWGLEVS